MNNNMFEILNSIPDDGIAKSNIINELAEPPFGSGTIPAINRLILKMIEMGLLEEKFQVLNVTAKGKSLCNSVEYNSRI